MPVTSVTLKSGTRLGELGAQIKNGLPGGVQHQIVPGPGQFEHGAVATTLMENSFHHQAVDRLGQGLRVAAEYSETYTDPRTGQSRKLIAAYEADPSGPLAGQHITGVQWHPEFGASPLGAQIFGDFVGAARVRAQQPEVLWSQKVRPQPMPGQVLMPAQSGSRAI